CSGFNRIGHRARPNASALTNRGCQTTLHRGYGSWFMPAGEFHKRVLLLGPTGVDKGAAVARLNARLKGVLGHQFRYVDFENDFLKPKLNVRQWTVFLAQDIDQQATTWRLAWDELRKSLDHENTVLGLHATYVSGPLGLRCPIHIPSICDDY